MNNEIQRFEFKGASLRALTDEAGEPWFVAKDACDILGNDTNHLREALDDDEITTSVIRRFGISQGVRLSSSLSPACTSSSCARVSRRRRSSSVG